MNSRVKKLRERLGLSQDALGKILGVGRSAVSKIESGTTILTESNIKLLCLELGANREWLVTGKGEMLKAAPSDELDALARKYHLRHKEYVLIEKLVTMSETERDGIFRFMMDVVAAATGEGADPDAYVDQPSSPGEMTLEEIHAEIDRQWALEKERKAKSEASGSGNSDAAIA